MHGATAVMDIDHNHSGQRLIDPDASASERSYALLTHLSPFAGYVALAGHIPGVSVLVPLILWQVRKKDSPFLDDHGREAVNFHITMTLVSLVGLAMSCGAAVLLWPAMMVFIAINMTRAAVAANRGEFFRYPCCLRLLG